MKSINRTPLPVLITGILWLLCGCTNDSCLSEGLSGAPVAFSIRLTGSPAYSSNSTADGTPSTRKGELLLSEWVKVNTFSVTRSGQESDPDSPQFAAMELFEDKVSDSPQTRATMQTGIYFRLIVFKKSGNDYIFQSVADYASDGSSAPVLKQGSVKVLLGQTVRFVAYSFNKVNAMGSLPSSYTWNSTSIPIPDLTNDFLTYDSGDVTPTSESMSLGVSFIHRLCRLTVQISATGFSSNTFSNCTGVYVKQGGSSSSWTVGGSTVSANTSNTAMFNIPDNSTDTSVRLVPFASARPITVHISTLTVGGKTVNNADVTSSQSVQLQGGKSYTMTVQFKDGGSEIIVAPEDITLSHPESPCTDQDKIDLSQLRWAPGNLRQTNDDGTGAVIFAGPTDYGHYYTGFSTYTGNTTYDGVDPCTKVPATFGTGWRLPTHLELPKLARCTDTQVVTRSEVNGMWFMNNTIGLFLPAAGDRPNDVGSGTTGIKYVGERGEYRCDNLSGPNFTCRVLIFYEGVSKTGYTYRECGFSVRCVKKVAG